MGIFRKATRLGGRVAKNAARQIIAPEDEKSKKDKGDKSAEPAAPQHSDAEYNELQEKYNALMTEKWKEYYKTSCDGECETCEYYDWCPDDFDGVFEDEAPAEDAKAESAAAKGEEAVAPDVDEGAEADEADEAVEVEVEEENDVELTDEERAAKAAAEAYYEDGCDGDCDNCEHYDWCPAEGPFQGRHAGRREECCQGRRRACARDRARGTRFEGSPRRHHGRHEPQGTVEIRFQECVGI